MRYLPLVLAIGCTTSDPAPEDLPELGMAVEAVTACPLGQWCVESSPASDAAIRLHAVFAVTADDVFAVGDSGTILHRAADTWSAMDSGTTVRLQGVWGTSSSDVWATGLSGTILHFDGTAWSPVTAASTAEVDAVWGTSASDVWFVGSGTVQRWNGTSISLAGSFSGSLIAVSGTGPQDVWITGENAGVRHWNGSTWSLVSTGAGTSTYFTVLAIATNNVWVTDFSSLKETINFTGGKWVPHGTSSTVFNSMAAVAANDLWAVGSSSKVGHWNGTSWASEQPFGSIGSLWSVTTTPGNAWIVGDGGLIAHRSF